MSLIAVRYRLCHLALASILAVGLAWTFIACAEPAKLPTVTAFFISPDGSKSPRYTLEVCATEAQRALGLMYRRSLSEQSGMIFLFPEERENSFWMKNTYIPLDMVFLDREMKVVGILENVPPLNEAPRSVGKRSMYVAEFKAGVTRKDGVREGSKLAVHGNLPAAQ